MVTFLACTALAGAVLSLVLRYHGLLLVMAVLALATALDALLARPWLPEVGALPFTILAEILALQVGYAAGVLARSCLGGRRDGDGKGAAPEPRNGA